MIKNKKLIKGFTIVELIAIIVILGVVLLTAVPSVYKIMGKFRVDYYDKLEGTINESGKEFFNENIYAKPSGLLNSQIIYLNDLVSEGYISKVVDYNGDNCDGSYVIAIYKGNGEYIYNTCLKCASDDYDGTIGNKYCDSSWKDNDAGLIYTFGTKGTVYIYYGTAWESIKEKISNGVIITKLDSNNNVLEVINNDDKKWLPVNIGEIDSTPSLNKNTKVYSKTYELKYSDTYISDAKAVIYRHMEPVVTLTNFNTGTSYIEGAWTNALSLTLRGSTLDTMYSTTGDKIAAYQIYRNGVWNDLNCDLSRGTTCNILWEDNITGSFKFRIRTVNGNISEETRAYYIKIDSVAPRSSITYMGGMGTLRNQFINNQIVKFSVTNSDDYSGVDHSILAMAILKQSYGACQTPTDADFFDSDMEGSEYTHSQFFYSPGTYCVWYRVYDNAGNQSLEVYPSTFLVMPGTTWGTTTEATTVPPEPDPTPEPQPPIPGTTSGTTVPYEKPEPIIDSYTIQFYNGEELVGEYSWKLGVTYQLLGKQSEPYSHSFVGWYRNNSKGLDLFAYSTLSDSEKKNMYDASSDFVLNELPLEGVVVMQAQYKHSYEARTYKTQGNITNHNSWPWTLLQYDEWRLQYSEITSTNLKKLYGCSAFRKTLSNEVGNSSLKSKAQTCIGDIHEHNNKWEGYRITCSHCGEYATSKWWCPVHATRLNSKDDGDDDYYDELGGSGLEVCSAAEKLYSNCACQRGVKEDWTRVDKDLNKKAAFSCNK